MLSKAKPNGLISSKKNYPEKNSGQIKSNQKISGEKNLAKLIESMTPQLLNNEYIFGTLEFGTLKHIDYQQLSVLEPIGTFQEKEGLTVILTKEKANQHNVSYQGVFKCITLNVHSSLDAVGLTAAVASALAQENISANVVAAYFHDHIFIASKDADNALKALHLLSKKGLNY